MRGKFALVDPEEMEASLTVTMKIKDWRDLMRQMPHPWPAAEFGSLLATMIGEAGQTFHANEQDIKP